MAWRVYPFLLLPPMLAGCLLGRAWNARELRAARWSWVVATCLALVAAAMEVLSRGISPEERLSGILDRIGDVLVPLLFFSLLANVIIAIGTMAHSPNARAASLLGCAVVFALACAAVLVGAASGGMIG
jgi:hypothetical protein